MAESPYTRARDVQYRGPSTSDDYNARLEENYKDLVVLYNRTRILNEDIRWGFRQFVRDNLYATQIVNTLEAQVQAIQKAHNIVDFYDTTVEDNNRFNGTAFEIPESVRCDQDSLYGQLTLPQVQSSSFSKLNFINDQGEYLLPSTLETRVETFNSSVDNPDAAAIDSSLPEYAMLNDDYRIWERNVVVDAPGYSAESLLYIKLPTDLMATEKTNKIILHPYPIFSVDIASIEYTSTGNVLLQDSDGYSPLNINEKYSGDSGAIGWVPPGGWNGDLIDRAGPKAFYIDPVRMTGLRIHLRQQNYIKEGAKYVYSYGASFIGAEYIKFLESGKFIVKFEPFAGTISNVTDVQPEIFNVIESEYPDVFSFRTIYETAYNSGVYTTTPVPFSQRVWIEVTLNSTQAGGTPALSALTISYT